jgi:hypothetical protein
MRTDIRPGARDVDGVQIYELQNEAAQPCDRSE